MGAGGVQFGEGAHPGEAAGQAAGFVVRPGGHLRVPGGGVVGQMVQALLLGNLAPPLLGGLDDGGVDATGYLTEAEEAVAAAALIAAQCPGGEPVDMSYGPETPMPVFPSDLRALADEALSRIVSDEDGPASNWVDPEGWKQWRAMLTRLRATLAPPPPSIALFDVQP
ncbi:DUF4259 domain-containing protein [Streptomyces longwoodensis]|uniref:DUF4259 domain-containing protein n=1 Tax=Streptomyces longwoodensis TaxID=68231 RepID=UPI0033A7BF03